MLNTQLPKTPGFSGYVTVTKSSRIQSGKEWYSRNLEEAESMFIPYPPDVAHSRHNRITHNIENSASMEPTLPPSAANQLVMTMIRLSLEPDSLLSSLEVEVFGVSTSSAVSNLSANFEGRNLEINIDIDAKNECKIATYVVSNCNPKSIHSGTRLEIAHLVFTCLSCLTKARYNYIE